MYSSAKPASRQVVAQGRVATAKGGFDTCEPGYDMCASTHCQSEDEGILQVVQDGVDERHEKEERRHRHELPHTAVQRVAQVIDRCADVLPGCAGLRARALAVRGGV